MPAPLPATLVEHDRHTPAVSAVAADALVQKIASALIPYSRYAGLACSPVWGCASYSAVAAGTRPNIESTGPHGAARPGACAPEAPGQCAALSADGRHETGTSARAPASAGLREALRRPPAAPAGCPSMKALTRLGSLACRRCSSSSGKRPSPTEACLFATSCGCRAGSREATTGGSAGRLPIDACQHGLPHRSGVSGARRRARGQRGRRRCLATRLGAARSRAGG